MHETSLHAAGARVYHQTKNTSSHSDTSSENAMIAMGEAEKQVTTEVIEDSLINWIILKKLPFNFLDDNETRNLFNIINPDIIIPKKDAVKNKVLKKFEEMQQKIKLFLSTIPSKFSFTVDGWTSINNKSFYGITIHFIDDHFNLQSLTLDFVPSHGKHTGKAIAELFFKTVQFYGIEHKIQGITVDNAAANNTFLSELAEILKQHGINFNVDTQHFKCFAHILNLGVQDALKVLKFDNNNDSNCSDSSSDESDTESNDEYTCIDKLRFIIKKIKKSEQLDLKLQSACHSTNCSYLKPILDVRTRWNSTSNMLERALTMKTAINTLCDNNKLLAQYKINTGEWSILDHLNKFLKHFKAVSVVLGGDKYVTLPIVIVAFNLLLDKIDAQIARCAIKTSEADKIFLSALQAAKSKLLKHYQKTNWVYCAILLLDPRHKLETFSMTTWGKELMEYSFLTFKDMYKTKYYCRAANLSPSSSSSEKSSSNDVIDVNILYDTSESTASNEMQEIDEYLATKRSNKDEDILKFWYKYQEVYPNLAKMARDFLSTTATSVPAERLFSQAGLVLRKERNRLNETSARSLLCLKSWITAEFLNTM